MTERPKPDRFRPEAAQLAAIDGQDGEAVDGLLCDVALQLRADGLRISGCIQRATPDTETARAVMHLELLRDGSLVRISQPLGRGSAGCRLDPTALAELCQRLLEELDHPLDFVVLNRFGKAETEGHGLRAVYEKACGLNVPVLTAVRPDHRPAWQAFGGTYATTLRANEPDILAWCRSVTQHQ